MIDPLSVKFHSDTELGLSLQMMLLQCLLQEWFRVTKLTDTEHTHIRTHEPLNASLFLCHKSWNTTSKPTEEMLCCFSLQESYTWDLILIKGGRRARIVHHRGGMSAFMGLTALSPHRNKPATRPGEVYFLRSNPFPS